MRLYLSSERLGTETDVLLAMLTGSRVAIIANGYDAGAMHQLYRASVYDPVTELDALGLEVDGIDLRAHFDDPDSLKRRLRTYDLVWVVGGNSFVLRRAMRSSGFDTVIRELLEADEIAYGGSGAGAIVAGSSLRGMELMDDPFDVPQGYDEPLIWHGLGLTPFAIIPHYRSRHPDAAAAEKIVSYMEARKVRHRALSDGDVIVRQGNLERLAS